jgi:predicted exporter
MHRIRRWPLAVAFFAAALLTSLVFSRITMRSDLADLLPAGRSAASRAMLQQLRSGAASRLLLIGLENAAPDKLAAISTALSATLGRNDLFLFNTNGSQALDEDAEKTLFADRYLLSPATTADSFQPDRLRQDFQTLLQGLQSSASPLVQQFGLPDPTGTFPALTAALVGDTQLRLVQGVWFAPHRDRALLLVQLRADGLDLATEDAALAAIRAAFHAARDAAQTAAGARLLISGPAVFAHDAAQTIRSDVRLISIVSSLLVTALLFWRFRSLWVVAVIAIPLMLAAAAGAAAVQLGFGSVHAITLGFGMTMLGVAVDYPVLLIGHRKQAEPARFTLRRIGAAFNLAVTAAVLGLTGMVFSGFPGLSQLGVFSVFGLLTAAIATRLVLPRLIVAADLSPVSAGDPALLARIETLRQWRGFGVLPVLAAVLLLGLTGGPAWETDLARLSPVPARALALDAELRGELGAAEPGQMAVIQAGTAESVLQREEDLEPVLDRLTKDGAIAGADMAASLLPSARTQMSRQHALPTPRVLEASVRQAAEGLGFSETAFKPFLDDVAAARAMRPVLPAQLPGRSLAARLGTLLFAQGGAWFGIVAPRGVRDKAALAAALSGVPGLVYVDIAAETNAVAAGYTRQAWPWLAAGAGAAIAAVAAGLRDAARLFRVLGSIAAALLVTIAVLMLCGAAFSVIQIVALQFVAGIGIDYALFFSRTGLDAEERSRTLRTLFTCNAMALLTFGLLCLCRTPLLRDIGATVAIGVVAAMVFSFLFAAPFRPTGPDPA